MNLTKDTYEYLLNFADDKDVLNMLSTNKKFRNEEFFERILKRRYPLLLQFKKEFESYKDFFISSIFYISKLQEIYGIPYIPSKDYDPKEIYNQIQIYHQYLYTLLMKFAVSAENFNIIKLLLKKGVTLDDSLIWAVQDDNLNMVKYFVEKGATDLGRGLYRAVDLGYFDIVKYLVEQKVSINDIITAIGITEDEYDHGDIAEYLRQQI